MSPHELKALQTQVAQLEASIDIIKAEISERSKSLTLQQKKIAELKEKMKGTGKGIIVSEHAYLRYFERVLGFNLAEIREKILDETTTALIEKLGAGNGQYPNKAGGFVLRVKDGVITTIINTQ